MGLKKLAFFGLFLPFLALGRPVMALPGFYSLKSSVLPPAVVAAAQKAVEVWAPAGDYSEYLSQDYSELERKLMARSSFDRRVDMHNKINLAELRMCRLKRAAECLLSQNAARGSGFVTNNNVLISVRHIFSGDRSMPDGAIQPDGISNHWRALADLYRRQFNSNLRSEAIQAIEEFRKDPLGDVVFLLTDAAGSIVFDSSLQPFSFLRYGALTAMVGRFAYAPGSSSASPIAARRYQMSLAEDSASAEALAFNSDLSDPSHGANWILQDVVAISLKSYSLPSVAIAQMGCEPGDAVYNLGFPTATTTRKGLGFKDAVDMDITISQGRALSLFETLQRGKDVPSNAQLVAAAKGQTVFFSDADSAAGMSGGMMVNASGSVCGLLKGATYGSQTDTWRSDLGAYLFYSLGIRLAPGVAH